MAFMVYILYGGWTTDRKLTIYYGDRIMYYTITNTIGTEIVVGDITLVCGDLYDNKTKAGKDADYVLAFAKSDKQWRFCGKADIDFETFVDEITEQHRNDLAWQSEKINIQSLIRPSKDSKKAIKLAENNAKLAELTAEFEDGTITATAFAAGVSQLVNN